MNWVTVELWLGTTKELEDDFTAASETRLTKEQEVEEGISIRQLLDRLAKRNPYFAQKVYNLESKSLYPHLIMNYNNQVISSYVGYEKNIENGDKIIIFPVYDGG